MVDLLQQGFRHYDESNRGTISVPQFKAALQRFGVNKGVDSVVQRFARPDRGEPTVAYGDFIDYFRSMKVSMALSFSFTFFLCTNPAPRSALRADLKTACDSSGASGRLGSSCSGSPAGTAAQIDKPAPSLLPASAHSRYETCGGLDASPYPSFLSGRLQEATVMRALRDQHMDPSAPYLKGLLEASKTPSGIDYSKFLEGFGSGNPDLSLSDGPCAAGTPSGKNRCVTTNMSIRFCSHVPQKAHIQCSTAPCPDLLVRKPELDPQQADSTLRHPAYGSVRKAQTASVLASDWTQFLCAFARCVPGAVAHPKDHLYQACPLPSLSVAKPGGADSFLELQAYNKCGTPCRRGRRPNHEIEPHVGNDLNDLKNARTAQPVAVQAEHRSRSAPAKGDYFVDKEMFVGARKRRPQYFCEETKGPQDAAVDLCAQPLDQSSSSVAAIWKALNREGPLPTQHSALSASALADRLEAQHHLRLDPKQVAALCGDGEHITFHNFKGILSAEDTSALVQSRKKTINISLSAGRQPQWTERAPVRSASVGASRRQLAFTKRNCSSIM
eukprot:gene4751-866_t